MVDGSIGAATKALLVSAAAVIVLAGLKLADDLVVPLLVAAFVAAVTAPMVGWLRRHRLPTFLAVTVTIIAVFAAIVGFGALFSSSASDLANSFPNYERALRSAKFGFADWLASHRLERFVPTVMSFDVGVIGERIVTGLIVGMPGALSEVGVVLFVVIFILLEAPTFQRRLSRALNWEFDGFLDIQDTLSEVHKYLLVKTGTSMLTGVACGLWCIAVGMREATLWGLVSFLLAYIPVFGSAVVTVAATGIALLQLGSGPAIGLAAGFTVINAAIGNLLEPKVLGRAVGLSPLAIVISIVLWGWVLGPIGALLSVPLTMVFKIVAAHTEDLRWLAVLLGPGEGRDEQRYVEERRRSRLSRISVGPPSVPPPPISDRPPPTVPPSVPDSASQARS